MNNREMFVYRSHRSNFIDNRAINHTNILENNTIGTVETRINETKFSNLINKKIICKEIFESIFDVKFYKTPQENITADYENFAKNVAFKIVEDDQDIPTNDYEIFIPISNNLEEDELELYIKNVIQGK